MKKIIVAILVLISIGLIAVVFITKDERNKNTDKLTNFSNDFFGISFLYPEYLTSKQAETNFARYSEERVSFYEQRASGLLSSTVAFQIRLEYEKFNENEVFEYIFPEEMDKFKEVRPISLINSAKAVTGPEAIKIKDVNRITIGDNIFYTYAYIMDGKRIDNFIIPQKFNSIVFTFYNQEEKFIKNILSSVERIDGVYSSEGKQIIKNENIGLYQVSIPRNWLVTNTPTSTTATYSSQDRNIEISITNFDASQNAIAEKMENLDHGRGLTRLEQKKIEDSMGCGGINNWLYLNNDLSGCIIDNNNGFKAYYKINNKKLFIYYNVVATGKKNEIERIYLSEILDSIIVSGGD